MHRKYSVYERMRVPLFTCARVRLQKKEVAIMTGSRDSLQNAAAATTAAEAMIMMPVGGDVMRVIAS